MENHPERVDVGIDSDWLAADLFRRSIRGRHHSESSTSLIGGRVRRIELLGDSEIEQLHFPIRLNQNVRRFQVPMDHGQRMRD